VTLSARLKRAVSKALGGVNRALLNRPGLRTRVLGGIQKFPWCERKLRMLFAEQFRNTGRQTPSSLNHAARKSAPRQDAQTWFADDSHATERARSLRASPLEREFRRYRNIE